jgi:hypothetical protein
VQNLETVKTHKIKSTEYTFSKQKMSSIYGSFGFDYKQLIYLNFTARNDWFSTLSAQENESNNDLYTSVNSSIILSEALKLPDWISLQSYGLVILN